MSQTTTKVNIKYQVVIPKEVRKTVHISANEKLGIYSSDENTIIIKKIPSSIKELKSTGTFKKDYLKKERLSW